MARPRKCRRICRMPRTTRFAPVDGGEGEIRMSLDEFESIRLIDLEHLQQEECALRMNVARTTVQSIYLSARAKLAEALVLGKSLRIAGGDVRLCERSGVCCPDVCDAHCRCGEQDCAACRAHAAERRGDE
ncbi:MAG: DUF134 domain-containing protein [Candidatus Spyradocola sp.]|jgi:predicted DNA-binding protein (UPF0251 family)